VFARRPEQIPQAQGAFGAQSIRRPGEAIEMRGELRPHVLDMTSASALVVCHPDAVQPAAALRWMA
jgi:hypothetical protein